MAHSPFSGGGGSGRLGSGSFSASKSRSPVHQTSSLQAQPSNLAASTQSPPTSNASLGSAPDGARSGTPALHPHHLSSLLGGGGSFAASAASLGSGIFSSGRSRFNSGVPASEASTSRLREEMYEDARDSDEDNEDGFDEDIARDGITGEDFDDDDEEEDDGILNDPDDVDEDDEDVDDEDDEEEEAARAEEEEEDDDVTYNEESTVKSSRIFDPSHLLNVDMSVLSGASFRMGRTKPSARLLGHLSPQPPKETKARHREEGDEEASMDFQDQEEEESSGILQAMPPPLLGRSPSHQVVGSNSGMGSPNSTAGTSIALTEQIELHSSTIPAGGDASGNQAASAALAAKSSRSRFAQLGAWLTAKGKFTSSGGAKKKTSVRVAAKRKEVHEIHRLRVVQRLAGQHVGPVWLMEFAPNGSYLATGGKDGKILLWEFLGGVKHGGKDGASQAALESTFLHVYNASKDATVAGVSVLALPLFSPEPRRVWTDHTQDVTCLAWSNSSVFLVSGSVDKTARIWSVEEPGCLSVFRHPEIITAVDFHPQDESIFMTGGLDRTLRLWDIPNRNLMHRAEVGSYITAAKFNTSGEFIAVGLSSGNCSFFTIAGSLRFYTQVEIRNNAKKVTSVRFVSVTDAFSTNARGPRPSPPSARSGRSTSDATLGVERHSSFGSSKSQAGGLAGSTKRSSSHRIHRTREHILVTTNDSRTRLYRMDDFSLVCTYRGAKNDANLPIGASASRDGRHIMCGSDDRSVLVWRLQNDMVSKTFLGAQGSKDVCVTYEAFHASASGPVTATSFVPPHAVESVRGLRAKYLEWASAHQARLTSHATVAANESLLLEEEEFEPPHTPNASGSVGARNPVLPTPTAASGSQHSASFASSKPRPLSGSSRDPSAQLGDAEVEPHLRVGLLHTVIVAAGADGVIGVFEVM